jgi:hypothetical protein
MDRSPDKEQIRAELGRLAELLRQYAAIGDEIAQVIGRPVELGHLGEYVAARIFGIALEHSATTKGFDGRFKDGPLAGCTVNVKWYGKREGVLGLDISEQAEHYLVFTGPRSAALSSRGATRPWRIDAVYLFDARQLHQALRAANIKIDSFASSVRDRYWEAAEIYPTFRNSVLPLTDEQRRLLALFGQG